MPFSPHSCQVDGRSEKLNLFFQARPKMYRLGSWKEDGLVCFGFFLTTVSIEAFLRHNIQAM